MANQAHLIFTPFQLDPANAQLWRGGQEISLRRKTFNVLCYLVEHPGELVTKAALLDAVWAGVNVSDSMPAACVVELRKVLGDEARTPRFIETVHRRGYRFIAKVTTAVQEVEPIRPLVSMGPAPIMVGRDKDLAQLQDWYSQALQGQRQVIFVVGEAGIGKTSLVEAFLLRVQSHKDFGVDNPNSGTPNPEGSSTAKPWIGEGQCIQHYGAGEAYLPLLDALGRLGRQTGSERVLEVLRRQAPSWLVQLPALLEANEIEELQRRIQGVARERMLRELAEALETLTVERPVVLILEDLHWSDSSTVEFLSFLARRKERARLLVLGTYRPADVVVKEHPLQRAKQELQVHGLCKELALHLLTKGEVDTYLGQRLAESSIPTELAQVVHQRTDGNALFMVDFVEYLVQQRLVVEEQGRWVLPQGLKAIERGVPDSLQQLVTKQLEELPPEVRRVLEAASVAGASFATETVAAGLGVASRSIDIVCEGLAQQGQFIEERELEEWPDGTLTASYAFRHALYQQVLYGRLGMLQRVQLHRLIAERKEEGYREQTADIAAELAAHFEQGRDFRRAVQYHQYAGANALRRSAYDEARKHCERGLSLLTKLDDTVLRARQEIALRLILSNVQTATLNFTALELEQNLQQARQLGRVADDPTLLVTILIRLSRVYMARADRRAMEELAEQDHRLLEQKPDPALAIQLHVQLGNFSLFRGEHDQAQYHYAQILALFDPAIHRSLTFSIGIDPVVQAFCFSGWSSCLTGYLDRARQQVEQGIAVAEAIAHPFSLASALTFARVVLNCCGALDQSREFTERSIILADQHGFPVYAVAGLIGQGSVAILRGEAETGLTKLRKGIEQYRGSGAQLALPYYLSNLADGYWQLQKPAEGLQVVAEALQLVETNLDVFWTAELHRLKGELLLVQQGKSQSAKSKSQKVKMTDFPTLSSDLQDEAEACFRRALEIARRQQARFLELRAAMSLSRLRLAQGKKNEGYKQLSEVYSWFTEGFDTKDLREAKALLAQLS